MERLYHIAFYGYIFTNVICYNNVILILRFHSQQKSSDFRVPLFSNSNSLIE